MLDFGFSLEKEAIAVVREFEWIKVHGRGQISNIQLSVSFFQVGVVTNKIGLRRLVRHLQGRRSGGARWCFRGKSRNRGCKGERKGDSELHCCLPVWWIATEIVSNNRNFVPSLDESSQRVPSRKVTGVSHQFSSESESFRQIMFFRHARKPRICRVTFVDFTHEC